MPQIDINFLAVLVATIVSMVLGALWYSPILFGKLWAKLSKFTEEDIEKAKKKGMTKNYILNFISLFVMV